ncbi:MAG: hypothetical protein ACLGI2_01835 [Acidimicrobiia bacterium]
MIDWRAVGAGAALALAVMVSTMVAVEVVDATVGINPGSNWVFLFYLVALGGLAAGGRLAARRRPDAPLAHGLLAALAAYAAVAGLGIVLRLTVDRGPDPVALAFNALMAASAGILGTLVAERASR